MKKRLISLFLTVVLLSSLCLSTYAIGGLEGVTIEEGPMTGITLSQSASPTGAIAVGRTLSTGSTYYLRLSGALVSSTGDFSVSGWMPDELLNNGADMVSPTYIVGGNDDRTRLYNSYVAPYSAIGLVVITWRWEENGVAYTSSDTGTGWLISKNTVITSAHLLCSRDKGWATEVLFIPGINQANALNFTAYPFGYANATDIAVSVPWYESEYVGPWYDWGVMRLDSDIGLQSGFLGFKCLTGNPMNTPIVTSGYPGDLNNGVLPSNNINATAYQYYSTNLINFTSSGSDTFSNITHHYRLYYTDIDSCGGQSGAPLLYYVDGEYEGCGIVSEATNSVYTECIGINEQLFSFLLGYRGYPQF